MTYSRRNIAEEQKEAEQKATHIQAICDALLITLDPIDWQHAGIRAVVAVNTITIGDLVSLGQLDSDSILSRIRSKLLEHAALKAVHPRLDLKTLMWSPLEVIQPQAFLSLWILTMETYERIPVAEYIRNGQRVYEHYAFNVYDERQLVKLFGPAHTAEYRVGDPVTIEERERTCSGKIVYVLPPIKAVTNRKTFARGEGRPAANEFLSRYLVDCNDGFPHVAKQSQITSNVSDIHDDLVSFS